MRRTKRKRETDRMAEHLGAGVLRRWRSISQDCRYTEQLGERIWTVCRR